MSHIERQIAANLEGIHAAIANACARVGRPRDTVQLVAVTKYAEWSWVEALIEQGVRTLGESRPQQLAERWERLRHVPDVQWHLIGHLQRNKVRPMLPKVARFHSVDSFKLLERMDLLAEELEARPQVFLEVNVSGEAAKDGFSANDLESQLERLTKFSRVQVAGLMTMAPLTEDEGCIRQIFRDLRLLRDRLEARSEGLLHLPELSMGMSGDFEIGIEEGATHIRIGSRLFEGLELST